MVDVYQVVLGAIAVSTMILVPVGVVLLYGLLAGRWDAAISNWRGSRRQKAERRRNLRAMRRQRGVPLEQVAANLRRLRGVLTVDAHRSAVHQIGNRVAYDQVLIQASEMLQIEHDLAKRSAGMERNIERLRVEAELERAGVVLSDRRYGQAA
ncbi:MAG TPA: hypothetical protein VK754_06115 [Propionibacteriaceae bacterium]|jgi:hypothetical protein|nr:hypothetical protein [Propionibacteriaceae bacterium]